MKEYLCPSCGHVGESWGKRTCDKCGVIVIREPVTEEKQGGYSDRISPYFPKRAYPTKEEAVAMTYIITIKSKVGMPLAYIIEATSPHSAANKALKLVKLRVGDRLILTIERAT